SVVELSYNNVSGSNDQVTDFSNLTIAKAPTTGSAWTDISGSASGNSSGIVTSGTFNSFSRFAIANKSSGLNPLPIELLNFEVTPKESVVELVWSTASETNNDYFSIERTRDGINFEEIGRIKGAGNSTYLLNYVTTDNAPFQGISYYRLKQTDFDGKFSYSGLKKVEFKSNPDISFNVYPNPSEGEEINIDFTTDQDEELIIEMRDLNGKTIYSLSMIVDQGNNKHTIYLTNRLAKGTYIITTNTLHGLHLYSKQIIVD
ncbi:MAG TPA: T9SS type A sorting domain-containing protein, partial [Bacteroidia bacterium]|nr:T9SS type A sorting domain-containing protein [Bacteroidia bacterium]